MSNQSVWLTSLMTDRLGILNIIRWRGEYGSRKGE
jgi:hypothetical protein